MQPDPAKSASDGFMVNLAGVRAGGGGCGGGCGAGVDVVMLWLLWLL